MLLYFRFTLSLRDVEDMLAQRGIELSYETVRCWAQKFGQSFAQNLRRHRPSASGRWHLDEMVVKIGGKRMWLWRAVNDEGEVLEMLVQKRRNTVASYLDRGDCCSVIGQLVLPYRVASDFT